MTPVVLYEDADLMVLDKPCGMVVNRAESVQDVTVQDWAVEYLSLDQVVGDNVFANRSGMVHRLDRDTSGLLLWAKHEDAMFALMDLFKRREIHKTYLAVVYGVFEPVVGDVRLPIKRLMFDRRRFTVDPVGKYALTDYERVALGDIHDQSYSLMKLHPVTGRTHQLRVHLSWLSHPIVGDPLYAGKGLLSRSSAFCSRLFLHAYSISFVHPMGRQPVTFECQPSGVLARSLAQVFGSEYVF